MKAVFTLLVLSLFACSNRPTNFTGQRCLSNVDCEPGGSCLTYREGEVATNRPPYSRPGIRQGLCLRDN